MEGSEIARLMAQISAEQMAAEEALTGLSCGSARHAVISARMERAGSIAQTIIRIVGYNAAMPLIVEAMNGEPTTP